MKKLLYLIGLFISLGLSAQQNQNLGSSNTIVTAKGQFLVDTAFRYPQDTTASAPVYSEAFKSGSKYYKDVDGRWHISTDYVSPYYRRYYIRNLQTLWYNMIKNNGTISCVFLGDSETDFPWIFHRNWLEIMNLRTNMGGPGYIAASSQVGYDFSASPPLDAGSNWNRETLTSSGKGLSMYSAVSTATPGQWGWSTIDAAKTFPKFTNLDVVYDGQVGGGNFSVKIDGTIIDTINTSIGTGPIKHSYTGLSDATHAVVFTSLTTNARVLGAYAYRSGGGFIFSRVGQVGAKTSDYLALDSANFVTQLKMVGSRGPDIVFIFLGMNDKANAGISPDTFMVHEHKIITRVKAANPLADIVLVGPFENDTAFWHSYPIAAYTWNQTLRRLCDQDTVAYFDIDKITGPYAKFQLRGGTKDGIHLDTLSAYGVVSEMINGLPITNTVNLPQLLQAAYGFLVPQNSFVSGSQGQLTLLGASNNIIATPTLVLNGSSRFLINTTDIAATTVQVGGTLWTSGGARINSATGTLGFQSLGGARFDNALYIGSTANKPANVIGIHGDGASVVFELTNQSSINGVKFENFAAVSKDLSGNGIANLFISQDIGAVNTNNNNYYNIYYRPTINNTSAATNTSFNFIDFSANLTARGNAVLRGIHISNLDSHFGDSASARVLHGPFTKAQINALPISTIINQTIGINKDSAATVAPSANLNLVVLDSTLSYLSAPNVKKVSMGAVRGALGSSTPTAGSLGTNVTSITPTGSATGMQLVVVTSGAVSGTLGVITYPTLFQGIPTSTISAANSTTIAAILGGLSNYIIYNSTSATSGTLSGVITAAGTYTFNIVTSL